MHTCTRIILCDLWKSPSFILCTATHNNGISVWVCKCVYAIAGVTLIVCQPFVYTPTSGSIWSMAMWRGRSTAIYTYSAWACTFHMRISSWAHERTKQMSSHKRNDNSRFLLMLNDYCGGWEWCWWWWWQPQSIINAQIPVIMRVLSLLYIGVYCVHTSICVLTSCNTTTTQQHTNARNNCVSIANCACALYRVVV